VGRCLVCGACVRRYAERPSPPRARPGSLERQSPAGNGRAPAPAIPRYDARELAAGAAAEDRRETFASLAGLTRSETKRGRPRKPRTDIRPQYGAVR
jgi:hypothetical protein